MLIKASDVEDESSTPTWFVIAKKEGDPRVINGIRDFGFQPTDTSAIDHAIAKLMAYDHIRRKYAGYRLYPIPAHLHFYVPVIP